MKSDGTVYAWGDNTNGQIGNGSSGTNVTSPWQSSLSGIIQVAGGHYHSMALKSDGTVYVWGDNSYGQGGNGTSSGTQTTPTQVQPGSLTGIIQIAAGFSHCMALKSDGTVYAWGYNSYGEIGNGNLWRKPDNALHCSGHRHHSDRRGRRQQLGVKERRNALSLGTQ